MCTHNLCFEQKYEKYQTSNYHRDSRQEFEKVGGIFPILHVVFLLDASN